MPKISEVYAGQYVNAVDLPVGRRITAVIRVAVVETVGQGPDAKLRVVLDLCSPDGRVWPKQVVLNKTNGTMISAVHGDEIGGWINQRIEVWREKVMYQGKMVDAIRMTAAPSPPPQQYAPGAPVSTPPGVIAMPPPASMAPPQPAAPAPPPAPPPAQSVDEALSQAPPRRVVFDEAGTATYADALDDEIPF